MEKLNQKNLTACLTETSQEFDRELEFHLMNLIIFFSCFMTIFANSCCVAFLIYTSIHDFNTLLKQIYLLLFHSFISFISIALIVCLVYQLNYSPFKFFYYKLAFIQLTTSLYLLSLDSLFSIISGYILSSSSIFNVIVAIVCSDKIKRMKLAVPPVKESFPGSYKLKGEITKPFGVSKKDTVLDLYSRESY